MKKILNCLALLTIAISCFGSMVFAETPLTKAIITFDKEIYAPKDTVQMSLKLVDVNAKYKTNSVKFDIEYDGNAFEMASNTPEKDISDGYIKFTTKNDIGQGAKKTISVMYVSMSEDINLKESASIVSVKFKVKTTANEGIKTFTLLPIKMYDSEFNSYKINEGKPYSTTITVKNTPTANINFLDVAKEHWAAPYIQILVDKKIAAGTDNTHFSPKQMVTRAQFAAFIVKALALEVVQYDESFVDVKNSDWFAGYIATAKKYRIINGVAEKIFDPNDNITREQMATMIMKVYDYKSGKNTLDLTKSYSNKFDDLEKVSLWAQDSVKAANILGIINGVNENQFNPKDTATREQIAVVIVKMLNVCNL